MSENNLIRVSRRIVENGCVGEEQPDSVAVEEPLEIRLRAGEESRIVAVTMRTPGHDRELAAGFLHCEQILPDRSGLKAVSTGGAVPAASNEIEIELAATTLPPLTQLERHFFTSSACGLCGKVAIDPLQVPKHNPVPAAWSVPAAVLHALPDALRRGQDVFEQTGGLHAAALFGPEGQLLAVREDVGRHNALDKLIGWGLLEGRLPFNDNIVMVSGRASFELLQKCAVAGAPVFCAVSAPSSLAVTVAERSGITLVGFLRKGRFSLYSHPGRIVADDLP